jgi:hypothetical protein
MSDVHPGGAAVPRSVVQFSEVVREVTRQLAPEELPEFEAVVDAWSSGDLPPRRSRRARGATVGLGIESILLSELLFPAVAGAISVVLGTVALEQIRPKRPAKHSPRVRRARPPSAGAAGTSPSDSTPGQLTSQQAQRLCEECQRLLDTHLPPAEAAKAAGVLLEVLRSGLWRSGS